MHCISVECRRLISRVQRPGLVVSIISRADDEGKSLMRTLRGVIGGYGVRRDKTPEHKLFGRIFSGHICPFLFFASTRCKGLRVAGEDSGEFLVILVVCRVAVISFLVNNTIKLVVNIAEPSGMKFFGLHISFSGKTGGQVYQFNQRPNAIVGHRKASRCSISLLRCSAKLSVQYISQNSEDNSRFFTVMTLPRRTWQATFSLALPPRTCTGPYILFVV